MSPILFERAQSQSALMEAIARLRRGRSGVALIAGEAGIGKSSLLSAVLSQTRDVNVLRGGCDDLVAANPLGPIREATRGLPPCPEKWARTTTLNRSTLLLAPTFRAGARAMRAKVGR
jgi:predicted ATPase